MHRTLRAVVAAVALTLIPVAGASAAPYASRTLSKGSSGSDVETLQRYLDQAGYETTADGEFGPATARSVRSFESAEQRRVDGKATRSDQQLVQSRAEEAEPETTSETTEDGYVDNSGLAVAPASAPAEVQAIIEAGNKIATKPYRYGGGHGRWRDSGYDCSGSISYALHGAGLLDTALDSTGFMRWGEAGKGTWVTTYAHGSHSYMMVAGLRFDTSGLSQDGSRWHTDGRSAEGYTVRHPPGL